MVEELENDSEMTKEMLSFVHAQVGFLMLFDLHFKEAIDHFMLSENMQPSELFPFIMPDPNRWTLLVCANSFCFMLIELLNTCFLRFPQPGKQLGFLLVANTFMHCPLNCHTAVLVLFCETNHL